MLRVFVFRVRPGLSTNGGNHDADDYIRNSAAHDNNLDRDGNNAAYNIQKPAVAVALPTHAAGGDAHNPNYICSRVHLRYTPGPNKA